MSNSILQQQQQQPLQADSSIHISSFNEILRISPHEFHFTPSRVSPGQISKIRLKNLSSSPVGYKFKTNAPLKYSVKPVLGVLAPEETIKIFVRCDNWISPQDKFLLQSVVLREAEVSSLDSRSWKLLDPKRFIECHIPCISVSALTLRDPEDDAGSISSSSVTSTSPTSPITSSSISPSLKAIDSYRLSPQRSRQQVFERWQYSESIRPTISIGGVGRRLSNSSSTSASPPLATTQSVGTYPTLFTPLTTPKSSMELYSPSSPTSSESGSNNGSVRSSKRNSISSNTSTTFQMGPNIITSTITEEPVGLDGSLSPSSSSYNYSKSDSYSSIDALSSQPRSIESLASSPPLLLLFSRVLEMMGVPQDIVLRMQSRLLMFWEFILKRILVLSLVCLFFGLVVPFVWSTTTGALEVKIEKYKDVHSPTHFETVQSPNILLNVHLREDW